MAYKTCKQNGQKEIKQLHIISSYVSFRYYCMIKKSYVCIFSICVKISIMIHSNFIPKHYLQNLTNEYGKY